MDRYTTTFDRQMRIAAPAARVWRALCDPAEVAQWDNGVRSPIDAPSDYPQPGQRVRWRTTGKIMRILVDEPREVVPERRLRSHLSLGPARFDETYRLETATDTPEIPTHHCLLHMSMELHVVAVPLRLWWYRYFWRDTSGNMESALTAIRDHCEAHAGI